MDMKRLAIVAIVLTLTFAVELVSVNFAEATGSGIVFIKNSDRAQSSWDGFGKGSGNGANQGIGQ